VNFNSPEIGTSLRQNARQPKPTLFSSSNVFAKAQGIVKVKHRFLVERAREWLRAAIIPHFTALYAALFNQ